MSVNAQANEAYTGSGAESKNRGGDRGESGAGILCLRAAPQARGIIPARNAHCKINSGEDMRNTSGFVREQAGERVGECLKSLDTPPSAGYK